MCGIVGILDPSGSRNPTETEEIVSRMAGALRHRGPDDSGLWSDRACGVFLGHRRLAVVDLSPAGRQPMESSCRRYVLTTNGEIYNFRELTTELKAAGQNFRGHSDTEVMIEAFSLWGIERAMEKLHGMFAFALWDRQDHRLHLGRDRIGEKPLYYGWIKERFVFASELKAFQRHPDFAGEINREVLPLLLNHGYIPAPHSIYKGIAKLPPATILSVSLGNTGNRPLPRAYWALKMAAGRDVPMASVKDEQALIDEFHALLKEAVKSRMEADVPLGAFLSGGMDSSTIVALMQAGSGRRVRTFTVGFREAACNEAPFAAAVAAHLGTEHAEIEVTSAEALAVIPQLPTLYDEPFADPSQIPTFLMSRFARGQVTVCLSGDGGDELFGGYLRYQAAGRIWNRLGWIPSPMRGLFGKVLSGAPLETLDRLLADSVPTTDNRDQRLPLGAKLRRLATYLGCETADRVYQAVLSNCDHPRAMALEAPEAASFFSDPAQWASTPDFLQRMMYFDAMTYLPDDILVKLDRASMAVSLEARVPLLDHRVVEFAWRLPSSLRLQNGKGKRILREVLRKHLPERLIDRPKMGFGIPLDDWLRGPLRDWTESILDEKRLRREGFLNHALVREKWDEHLSGRRSHGAFLWSVLMFGAWIERKTRAEVVPGS